MFHVLIESFSSKKNVELVSNHFNDCYTNLYALKRDRDATCFYFEKIENDRKDDRGSYGALPKIRKSEITLLTRGLFIGNAYR